MRPKPPPRAGWPRSPARPLDGLCWYDAKLRLAHTAPPLPAGPNAASPLLLCTRLDRRVEAHVLYPCQVTFETYLACPAIPIDQVGGGGAGCVDWHVHSLCQGGQRGGSESKPPRAPSRAGRPLWCGTDPSGAHLPAQPHPLPTCRCRCPHATAAQVRPLIAENLIGNSDKFQVRERSLTRVPVQQR